MASSQLLPDHDHLNGNSTPISLTTLPVSLPSDASFSTLLAAFEQLSAFTRCDRCNRSFTLPSSSSSSSVVQITSDCDHLFCLECDACTLPECPVCRRPTLPRKHMVHLTQIASMLDLVEDLRTELKKAGLLQGGGGDGAGMVAEERDKADEAFEAAIRQCSEELKMDDALPPTALTNTPPHVSSTRKREKRRLTSTTILTRQSTNKTSSRADEELSLPSPEASRAKRTSSKPQDSPENSRPPLKDLTKEQTAAKTNASTSAAAMPSISPSPTTAQRLFSTRRKREIVKAKRKEVNENGETPLHVAARRGQLDKVDELLKHGAETNTKGIEYIKNLLEQSEIGEKDVFSLRGEATATDGSLAVLVLLLWKCPPWSLIAVDSVAVIGNHRDPYADFAGLSPLFDACGRGFDVVVERLLLAGAHPNTPCGKDNDTPLHEAAFHGNIKIINHLLCHGANPFLENIHGKTPYDLARHESVQTFLMERIQGSSTGGQHSTGNPSPGVLTSTAGHPPLPLFLGSPLRPQSPQVCTTKNVHSPAIAALDKIPSTSSVSPTEVVIAATGIGDDDESSLSQFAVTFGARVVDSFYDVDSGEDSTTAFNAKKKSSNSSTTTSGVTHVVCAVDEAGNVCRTIKYLLGVVSGCKVVSFRWLAASLRLKRVQPEELFLVRGSTKNPLCEGPKKSLVSHFYNFPALFSGCRFYLDEGHRRWSKQPDSRELAKMIEAAGGVVLTKRPAWLNDEDNGEGMGSSLSVPFHAQKCRIAKNVNHYVVQEVEEKEEEAEGDEEEEEEVGACIKLKKVSLRVFKSRPHVGFATKDWLLDCFDRYEIVDAREFERRDGGAVGEKDAEVDKIEALRDRQSTRISRSKGDGTEYLMAL